MATFRAEWGIFFCAERNNVAACAGIECQISPECSVAMFCAEMEYLFLRGKEKCSRLRGNGLPFRPGILRGKVLRRNWGIFIPGMGLFGSCCYFVWEKNSFKSSGVHSIASPPCFWSGQYLYLMFTPCFTSSST